MAPMTEAETKLILFGKCGFLYAEDDDGLHLATHIQWLNRNGWQGQLSVMSCLEFKPLEIP